MKKEIKYALEKFGNALEKLSTGAEKACAELEKDGVVQRFEFSFELLWKTIKIVLRNQGVEAKTPKESLQEAFRLGWIREETVFLDMLEDRNKTSHIYDSATAEEIYDRIKSKYIPALQQISGKLEEFAD